MPDRSRTPAQIAASRANGRRSRGPKTASGKRRSRLNALKHGLRSATIHSLPKEEAIGAQTLMDAIHERLLPADDAERELAEAIVAALWRLRRARQIERELMAPRSEKPAETDPGAMAQAFIRDSHGPRTLDLLLRYRTQAVNELGRLLRLYADFSRQKPPVIAVVDVEDAANDNRQANVAWRPFAPILDD